jgi:hypothetical protein
MKTTNQTNLQIKRIQPRPYSSIRLTLKFQNCVAALRGMVDAIEELSEELIANEKHARNKSK